MLGISAERAPQTPAERARLLSASPPFVDFSTDQLAKLTGLLRPVQFAAGQTIVSEGDPADRWYLMVEGSVAVTHEDLTGQAVTLAVLGPGDSFGERALVGDQQRRSATISALTAVDAFALERQEFDRTMAATPEFVARLCQRLDAMAIDTALKRASPFASLPHDALRSLAGHLEPISFRRGEVIIRQGDAGDCVYLIRSGSVEVIRGKRHLAVLGPGDSFGEMALLTRAPRTATVRALENAQLLALGRDAFRSAASEHASVAAHFRELIGARMPAAAGQHLLIPDPVTTIMPLVGLRRRKRYWLVLLVGVALFALLTGITSVDSGHSAAYTVMAVGALIGPVVFVHYLAESNILAQRPVELVITAILGAALGLPPAIWLQRQSGLLPGGLLAAGLIASIEEPAKVLGVMWLLRVPALRFRMDGVIFGAAAGMGFAAIETALYALARIDTPGVLVGVLWLRALLSPFTHGTWTAIVCATLWRARAAGLQHAASTTVVALACAISLHALWDWQALPLPFNFVWLLIVGMGSVLTLRAILRRAANEEARAVLALAPEVVRGTMDMLGVKCAGCGRRAPPGARYCPRCGLALRRVNRAS